MADQARLEEIIAPEAAALGFDLVRVKMMVSEAGDGEQGLQIMAEDPATGQLLIEQCAALSRAVSARMEMLEQAGEMLIEGTYHLEVSSPGIDRPLTRAKDFANWAGYEVKISLAEKLNGQRSVKGQLIGIDGDEIVTVEDKQGKELSFPRKTIHAAKLVLTDGLIAATKPLDRSGADEVLEDNEEEKADQ